MRDCTFVHSIAAELALGSVVGRDRSYALSHLLWCESCRAEVEDLSRAADSLLLLAPEAEPPPGFEVRVVDGATCPLRPVASSVTGPRRQMPRVALAAAALVFASALFATGAEIGNVVRTGVGSVTGIRLADFQTVSGSSAVTAGAAVVIYGRPDRVFVAVRNLSWSGWLNCILTVDGRSLNIGSFELHGGAGSWTMRLDVERSVVRSARLVTPGGALLATADFEPVS